MRIGSHLEHSSAHNKITGQNKFFMWVFGNYIYNLNPSLMNNLYTIQQTEDNGYKSKKNE